MFPEKTTWIIGSSMVYWAAVTMNLNRSAYAELATRKTTWFGTRGMRWDQLLPKLRGLLQHQQAPDTMIIHLGGNDLTSTPLKALISTIKDDLTRINLLMPATRLIWSDITARIRYRNARSNAKVDKARKSLNATVRPHILKMRGLTIRHPSITWATVALFRGDGVHLTDSGNAILLQDWRSILFGPKK